MKTLSIPTVVTVLLIATTLAGGCARSGIEGTWSLVSRDLPDGTVVRPPAVMGSMTYAGGQRNFNVYWNDDAGNPVSISSIALYSLTGDQYRETNLYYRMSGMGAGEVYDMERQRGSSPVRRPDGRIEFAFPLHDEPFAVFDSNRFTATREGAFVDHWRRID